ncbi:hypothetical protein ABZ820_33350 [Streptomyces diacarni]|uniref:hypothetical protein n=1 Tax=Streptomyces diacarni TaxID=2800381 RepID=UPI0033DC0FB7
MKPTEYLTITERPNTSITVMSDSRGPLIVVSDGPGARAVRYTPDKSAKFALAILEAAGVESPYFNLGDAVDNLRQHVEREAKRTAEAKAQAELEAEALEMFNEYRVATQLTPIVSWDEAHPLAQEQWLAVARKSREMRAEK